MILYSLRYLFGGCHATILDPHGNVRVDHLPQVPVNNVQTETHIAFLVPAFSSAACVGKEKKLKLKI